MDYFLYFCRPKFCVRMYTLCYMSCMCASMKEDVRTICGESNNSHKGKMKDQKKAIRK